MKMFKLQRISFLLFLTCFASSIHAQTNFIWGKQYGSGKNDVAQTPVTDQFGNVYLAGTTSGILSDKSFGKSDGFVTKLDSSGNIIWTKQFGTPEEDGVNWLTIDKAGNLYATGYTKGVLNEKNFGQEDIMVVKLDNNGNIEWQKQYGTDSTEIGYAIYADDPGNIYVSGITKGLLGKSAFGNSDCFIMKLDNKGNQLFVSQFGSPENERCVGITGDNASNIFVCGITSGDLGAKNKGQIDAFVAKFNNKGEQLKIIQFGTTENDMASKIAVDKDKNIYIGGSTGGDLAAKQQGQGDAFLTKINANGDIIWTRQFGTPQWDGINGMDLNENISDNIIVSGCQNWPSCQSFIRMYKKDGTLLWVKNFIASGKSGGTCGKGVWLDNKGYIYHTGTTGGNLFNTNRGDHDVFVIKQALDKI